MGVLVFGVSGAMVWALLGAVLAALLPAAWAVVLGLVGALALGGAQLLSRGAARMPQRAWQVPSRWLEGRGALTKIVIWGTMLGPGLATRNPYASFWVVVPALGSLARPADAAVVGGVAGLAHGVARFMGILLRQRTRPDVDWSLVAVLWHLRFQRLDGVVLLLVGAGLAVALVNAQVG